MTQEFLAEVRSIVEPLLTELGFQLDEYMGDVAYDKEASAVFFRSNDCKIQVYDSRRNGEINCMIAALDAANTFGPYDRKGEWQYLPRFAIMQGVPLDEIKEEDFPDFPTPSQWLQSVRRRVEKYYPIAHEGILKIAGPEY